MNDLSTRFQQAYDSWNEHCFHKRHSSRYKDYLDCAAYQEIVAMGQDVLPLILKVIKEEKMDDMHRPGHLWAYLIHAIVGDEFRIKVEEGGLVEPKAGGKMIGIDVLGVHKFCIQWLERKCADVHQND